MAFRVTDWNCLAVGAWNPAVLTPNGIRQHLLGVGRDVPIVVEVNVEEAQPPRVRYNELLVLVSADHLLVAPAVSTLEGLRRAVDALRTGLGALTQTPVRAAGVNFRYLSADPTELLDARRAPPLDDRLEEQWAIVGRSIRRSITLDQGVINVEIREEIAGVLVEVNFHRDSTNHEDLSGWLNRVDEFHRETGNLLQVLGVTLGDQ